MSGANEARAAAGLRFKPYPAYKDSGVEWLGKIPAHWEVRRLKTVASVQLSNVDKKSVEAFFEREVKPHVPDAWIDTDKRDPKDGQVGIIGYEINFSRYFYRYTPPRPFEEIEADIRGIETDIMRMLAEVTGSAPSEETAGT